MVLPKKVTGNGYLESGSRLSALGFRVSDFGRWLPVTYLSTGPTLKPKAHWIPASLGMTARGSDAAQTRSLPEQIYNRLLHHLAADLGD